jgi:hypothetical protein
MNSGNEAKALSVPTYKLSELRLRPAGGPLFPREIICEQCGQVVGTVASLHETKDMIGLTSEHIIKLWPIWADEVTEHESKCPWDKAPSHFF